MSSKSMMPKVNTYALRAFRDTADKDYIHARMAYRARLIPQFHWSALHALEKYAKCISILLRIPKPKKAIKHEILRSLELISQKIDLPLSNRTKKFIERLEEFGARFRYLEVSWSIYEFEVGHLDRAVWELRRYCNAALYIYEDNQFVMINPTLSPKIKCIEKPTIHNTEIKNGVLEKILKEKNSKAKSELVWFNLYYSNSCRKKIKVPVYMMAENSPFYLNPEIIDEVSKYSFVPLEVIKAYKNNQ